MVCISIYAMSLILCNPFMIKEKDCKSAFIQLKEIQASDQKGQITNHENLL